MESELGRTKLGLERGVQLVVGMESLCMDEGLESVDGVDGADEVDGLNGPEGQVWHIWEGEGRGLDRQP